MAPKKGRPKKSNAEAPPAEPAPPAGLPPVAFEGFPPVPDEPHLTVDGAILDPFGKLELSAYIGLKELFADEAPRESHPVQGYPGTQLDEQEQLQKGLKWWSDPRGKGWIATWKKDVKWFNASKWGSWRLAFVLARLQRDVWSKREAPLALEDGVAEVVAPAPRKPKRGRASKVQAAEVEELQNFPGRGLSSSSVASADQRDASASADAEVGPSPGKKPRKKTPAAAAPAPAAEKVDEEMAAEDDYDYEDEQGDAEALEKELEDEDAAEVAAVRAVMGAATEVAASVRRKKRPSVGKLPASRSHGRSFSAALNATAPQRQGIGSGDDVVILPDARHAPAAVQACIGFPAEPEEARLTVEGAKLEENGKLMASEYVHLKDHFADEAPREMHPVPVKPGVKKEEQEQLQGLRSWSDAKGQGWIASGQLTHWFSVKKWGSWRLAFLLARLQVAVWSKDDGAESAAQQPQPTIKRGLKRDKDQKPQRGRHFKLRRRERAHPELRIATVRNLKPKRVRKPEDRRDAVVNDETRLSEIRAAPGKMPKEGARMDPRSKLIQLRRREKAGLRVGVRSSSSFEALGQVIDEARSVQQLDLLVIASASHDELGEAGVKTALTSEERATMKADRAAVAQAREARFKNAAKGLVHSATVRSPLKGVAEDLARSAAVAAVPASTSSSSSSAALPAVSASVPEAASRSAASPAPTASLPEAATRQPVASRNVADAAAEASELPVAHVGADGVLRIGPKAEEDVNAVIRELLKIGAMY